MKPTAKMPAALPALLLAACVTTDRGDDVSLIVTVSDNEQAKKVKIYPNEGPVCVAARNQWFTPRLDVAVQ